MILIKDMKPYQAENDMELFEYHLLERQQTHLPMRIYVDDGGAYLRHDHPLWLYMCNGYQTDSPVIPVNIREAPCIPLEHYDLHVSESHLEKVYIFIKDNYDQITDIISYARTSLEAWLNDWNDRYSEFF